MDKHSDDKGFFGNYGGSFVDAKLKKALEEVKKAYDFYINDKVFLSELKDLQEHFSCRPTPVYFAKNLTSMLKGANIYLKREDLNHTGAHKINHCLGEGLLAKKLNKRKVIAETGAGQHGVAMATVAALLGLECDVYMGAIDVMKEAPNVTRMKILGAHVHSVSDGTQTLKDAVDAAFRAYAEDPEHSMYCIGTVCGPEPFPDMVRDFQSVIGTEAREQMLKITSSLPDAVIACVGGGSNAMGIFSGFLNDEKVKLYGVEPAGRGLDTGKHAATLTKGKPGILHGCRTYLLQDDKGEALPVYSIASGLDYPGVGPQHSYLKDLKRVNYVTATDREAVQSFYLLSRTEGIIPALESSHALAYAAEIAKKVGKGKNILVNLSGRGDKDIDFVIQHYPLYEFEQKDKSKDSFENFLSHIGEYR